MPASVQLVLKSDGMKSLWNSKMDSMLQGHMPGEGAEGTHLEMGDSTSLLEAGLGDVHLQSLRNS